ncbi:hypothetical protein LCGC14_1671930 [marine sediment metagenome]|uniref:Uncharacterized protein n=1 Tax=marine sediment metagenome TaxID=412755 RepID=A0A0F9K6W0_9ZZZZ
MKIELVEWVDSRAILAEWMDAVEVASTTMDTLLTVGFVASENDERIILVSGHDPHMERYCGGLLIPKSAIVKRQRLAHREEKR